MGQACVTCFSPQRTDSVSITERKNTGGTDFQMDASAKRENMLCVVGKKWWPFFSTFATISMNSEILNLTTTYCEVLNENKKATGIKRASTHGLGCGGSKWMHYYW